MQSLAKNPILIIGLLAVATAFAALWLFAGTGLVDAAKGGKGGGGDSGGTVAKSSNKVSAGGSKLEVMACSDSLTDATWTGKKVANSDKNGSMEGFLATSTLLIVDDAQLFGVGDVLRFTTSTDDNVKTLAAEMVKVFDVNYDTKVLTVQRGWGDTTPEFHAKDHFIVFVPESIDGSSYVANCPEDGDVITAPIERTLLYATMKLSDPTDLLIYASMECALWTNVQTTQNEYGEAFAQVRAWIEINGVRVPVYSGEEPVYNPDGSYHEDYGKVVMCSRSMKIQSGFNILTALQGIKAFDNQDLAHKHEIEYFIRLMMKTRNAQAFNWYALNMGDLATDPNYVAADDGLYHIYLKGELDAKRHNLTGFGADYAAAAVGKRTLIIEPVKFPTGTY